MNKQYRSDVREVTGEAGFTAGQIYKVVHILMVLGAGISGVGYVFGWFGEAAKVAQQEFGPQAMLQKYEWFKDAAAQLDKKQADIKVYQGRLDSMKADYEGTKRKDWDRTEKEQFSQWQTEVAGVTASYNGLAAEWNAQISKFNWKPFQGDLPAGASDLLSRQFAPYQSN